MEKFLYFQPEYVVKFKCDGAKSLIWKAETI